MKTFAALLLSAASLFAQGQAVNQTQGPPPQPWISLYFYNGSNQITYICFAQSVTFPATIFSKPTSTLTNIVVASNVGTITFPATAQFWVGQRATVSGSATTALNGTYKVTAVSGSTATITTVGVTDGTYADTGLTLTTSEPMLNAPLWSIQAFSYASSNLATSYWGGNPGGSVPQGLACSNRAAY